MLIENLKVSEIEVRYNPSIKNSPRITSPEDANELLRTLFPDWTIQLKEQFIVLYLNNFNRVIGYYLLSTGGITGTVVDIRIIFGVALKTLATGIIIAHNHPSGNLKPSRSDQIITDKIKKAAQLLDIEVWDHFILTLDSYYSFKEQGEQVL
jgi:DNA repair protein RadC